MIRDRRCKKLGTMSQAHLDKALAAGAIFVHAGLDEVTCLNAMYETLVAVEEHDLTVGNHEIDKRQLVSFFRSSGILSRTELFRHASKHFTLAGESKELHPSSPAPNHQLQENIPTASGALDTPTVSQSNPRSESKAIADFLIGDDVLESPHIGVLGELKDGRRKLAISLTKPQCLVLLGYMGSGKSYALGVLIESALLRQEGLIEQSRPMTVVAFNFRRNPEARFEHGGFAEPNRAEAEVSRLAEKYGAQPAPVEIVNVFGYKEELSRRETEYGDLKTFAIKFKPDELGAEHWEILMKPPTGEAEYMDIIRDIIQKLYYQERLTFENLERAIQTDERMSNTQRRRAMNRMSFAERWMTAEREYEWAEVLEEGSLNIFDLRMQTMKSSEALKLCLIITDLVRRTKNGVNKVIVFDEAHEYVDCKELVKELENSITQIRHDGLSFVLASQFPERIPRCIFQYLLTRLIFKLPNAKAINYVRHAAPNLEGLSPQRVANLDLEQGLCFIQTDDDCTDEMLRVPQQLEVRPRCTMHGGSTVRQAAAPEKTPDSKSDSIQEFEFEELEAELCPKCGEELVFRRTKSAALMVCSSYPDCKYSRKAE
ncbi:MAG: topoisomerase DNA-binding C4 zinc finger domain-containing protein [Gemmataceae bacterium]